MNPTEFDDKVFALIITMMVGTAVSTIASWKILEVIHKSLEQGQKNGGVLDSPYCGRHRGCLRLSGGRRVVGV